MLGTAIFMLGGHFSNLGAIYAGRFIAGLGVGQTTVVGPVYISEIAPASIRGLCTCAFTGAVYIGIVLAYCTNYGAGLHLKNTMNEWLVPTSLHIMFSGIILLLMFFQIESPRFYVMKGKSAEAHKALASLRCQAPDSDYVVSAIAEVQAALDHELEATRGIGVWGKIKEMFLVPSNLYRVWLATMVQIMGQWSGAGSITIYAADLFEILGITGTNEGLLVTLVFGVIKAIASIVCALFLVDVIGRKRSLLLGITLQSISMLYVAGFLTAFPQLGVVPHFEVPADKLDASRGAVAMIYLSGCGWALGWNSMQYLLTAELFPLRIRALATSFSMTLHFANQYGNSRAVPNMLLPTVQGGISPKGTFWCFAAVTLLGGLWVWFFVPETGGRTLESMDRLFDLPWYRIGLYGNKDADEQDVVHDEKARMANETLGHHSHIESKTQAV